MSGYLFRVCHTVVLGGVYMVNDSIHRHWSSYDHRYTHPAN